MGHRRVLPNISNIGEYYCGNVENIHYLSKRSKEPSNNFILSTEYFF